MFSNGDAGIGLPANTTPVLKLHVNGSSYLPANQSYWIAGSSDNGNRLRLHFSNSTPAAFIDVYPTMFFRVGTSTGGFTWPMKITSTGVGIMTDARNTEVSCALEVTGTAKVNGAVILTSDFRLKENVQKITSGSLAKLSQLNGFTYKLKTPNTLTKLNVAGSDSISENTILKDTSLYNRNHIGLIAQEVQKIYPELVYEDKQGLLAVDYISIIPLLIESIKEQSAQIETLKKQVETSKTKSAAANQSSATESVALLLQNTPNPFNYKTEISFYLPESATLAVLNIYNLNGNQLKSIHITQTGWGKVTLSASEFQPGMYLYSLLANGEEVDTKRMILTE